MRTLYRSSRVRTLSHPQVAEWVLVDGRHVQRVGSGDPPDAERIVELPGTTIVPGMIDTHVHLAGTGIQLANEDVRATRSAAELLNVVRRRALEARGEGVVFLRGFDESTWDDPRLPSAGELAEACARPLVIRRTDGHVALANEAAVEAAGIANEPGLERVDGRPTGRATGVANERLYRFVVESMPDHELQDLQLRAAGLAASRGVTAVHEMSQPDDAGVRDLQVFLGHRRRLPVDAMPVVATMDVAMAIDLGLDAIGGDLPVDGSLGARTAALAEPYADDPGEGAVSVEEDRLAEFFQVGHNAGLQVGVHAVGDRAIDLVIRVWERVYQALDSRERRHFRARRHRIEHASMADASHIERVAMLGLSLSIQPTFDLTWGGPGDLYERRLGPARAAPMHAIRTMLDRGVEVGVGSDAPVVPLDPWRTVHALELHHDASQRLSRFEAIRLHTRGSARIAHQEEKKGALEPGFHADFAAYEVDPFEVDEALGLAPVLTVSLGREVWAA